MAGHLPGKSGWLVAQVTEELKMMDNVRRQPVKHVIMADYPLVRVGSAPEFMPRLSGGVVGVDQRYPMLRRGRFQRG